MLPNITLDIGHFREVFDLWWPWSSTFCTENWLNGYSCLGKSFSWFCFLRLFCDFCTRQTDGRTDV